jgi:NAD(P)H-dependent FMN reductase
MMKILAIMGSPRGKGKGYEIVRMIEEGMKAKGEVAFEYLFLKDASLKPCLGCYLCMSKGEDKCPLTDERSSIENRILDADGIILSSPVYVLNTSGLMKNFIDRFAYSNHRPKFHSQKILAVMNSGGSGLKAALASLRNALGGAHVVRKLGLATPLWPQSESAVSKKKKLIETAAEQFYAACLVKTPQKPSLIRYTTFLLQQKFFESCKQFLTADYSFYSGKSYYFETKINPITKVLANAIVKLAGKSIKELGPGNANDSTLGE